MLGRPLELVRELAVRRLLRLAELPDDRDELARGLRDRLAQDVAGGLDGLHPERCRGGGRSGRGTVGAALCVDEAAVHEVVVRPLPERDERERVGERPRLLHVDCRGRRHHREPERDTGPSLRKRHERP